METELQNKNFESFNFENHEIHYLNIIDIVLEEINSFENYNRKFISDHDRLYAFRNLFDIFQQGFPFIRKFIWKKNIHYNKVNEMSEKIKEEIEYYRSNNPSVYDNYNFAPILVDLNFLECEIISKFREHYFKLRSIYSGGILEKISKSNSAKIHYNNKVFFDLLNSDIPIEKYIYKFNNFDLPQDTRLNIICKILLHVDDNYLCYYMKNNNFFCKPIAFSNVILYMIMHDKGENTFKIKLLVKNIKENFISEKAHFDVDHINRAIEILKLRGEDSGIIEDLLFLI